MDIAAMSTALATNQLRSDASLAIMGNVMDLMKQQNAQLAEMAQTTTPNAPHPALGNMLDVSV